LCKREKRKGKGVFLFFFSGVWIDREVNNYTSLFPYFRPLPCNQTAPEKSKAGRGSTFETRSDLGFGAIHRRCENYFLQTVYKSRLD